jgi:hypothetical protein
VITVGIIIMESSKNVTPNLCAWFIKLIQKELYTNLTLSATIEQLFKYLIPVTLSYNKFLKLVVFAVKFNT